MGFLSGIKNFIKPIASTLIKAVAPQAVDALKKIAGNTIQDLFQKGAGALSSLVGSIPLVGPALSGLAQKYIPGLGDIAQNWVNGGLDRLLSNVVGQPTERPVQGTNTSVTTPPLADPSRTTSIVNNTPSSNTQASTGLPSSPSTGGTSSSGGPSYNGSFPSYPTPPSDPKDLAAQNRYQEQMFAFQQASQNLNTYWQMMQNVLKSMGDTANNAARNLR